jgi:hypothetical protein
MGLTEHRARARRRPENGHPAARTPDLTGNPDRLEVGRIEGGQPVAQGEVRQGGLLRLQGDDAVDGVDHVQRFAAQAQLPAERSSVQLPGGEAHPRDQASASSDGKSRP